jgi:hypothetical protein
MGVLIPLIRGDTRTVACARYVPRAERGLGPTKCVLSATPSRLARELRRRIAERVPPIRTSCASGCSRRASRKPRSSKSIPW